MSEDITINGKPLPSYLDEQASININQLRKSEIFKTSKSKVRHITTKPKADWKYDKNPGKLKIYSQEELFMESLKEHYAARKEELENTDNRLKKILLALCVEEPLSLNELSDKIGELHTSISGYCSTLFLPRHGKKIRHLVEIDKSTIRWMYRMNPLAVKLNGHELSQLAIKRGTFTARDAGLKIPELIPLFQKPDPEEKKKKADKKHGGQPGPRGPYKPRNAKVEAEELTEPLESVTGIAEPIQHINEPSINTPAINNTPASDTELLAAAKSLFPTGQNKLTVDLNFNFNFNLGFKK